MLTLLYMLTANDIVHVAGVLQFGLEITNIRWVDQHYENPQSLSHTHTHTHTLTHSVSHSLALSESLSLTLSLTHTHIYTHTYTHTYTVPWSQRQPFSVDFVNH